MADVESLIKTRRSLIIASLSTIIFANLTIASEKISVLGVEILISQKNIVLAGQAGTIYLMAVFFLQSLPEFFSMFGWMWDARINSLERRAWNNFRDDWGFHDDDFGNNSKGPDADSEYIKWRFLQLRKKKTSWIEGLSVFAAMLANFSVAYLSPILAASLCLFWPTAVGRLLD